MKFNNKGFSLIELMIVVGIIGILASVAVPRFATYSVKARSSEAKVMLGQIATLQEISKSSENGTFQAPSATEYYGLKADGSLGADCDGGLTAPEALVMTSNLGFTLPNCDANTPLFGYNTHLQAAGYRATAMSGLTGASRVNKSSTTREAWAIDDSRALVHYCDSTTGTGTNCANSNPW